MPDFSEPHHFTNHITWEECENCFGDEPLNGAWKLAIFAIVCFIIGMFALFVEYIPAAYRKMKVNWRARQMKRAKKNPEEE